MEASEVERVKTSRDEWLGLDSICLHLEVPSSVGTSLVACGALLEDRHWRADICMGGPISLLSAKQLEVALRANHDGIDIDGPRIELQHLTSRRVGDKRALADVFGAITSGALRPAAALPASGIGEHDHES